VVPKGNVFLTEKIGVQAIFAIFPTEQVPFKRGWPRCSPTAIG